jgi:ubiquinone/menaquinone biosynthesis C-methylase UbiE
MLAPFLVRMNVDTTAVFSSKAVKYAKYRWDYAPQAIQSVLDITKLTIESTIADLGAGSGILTKHFVGKVKRIFVVEPNHELRQLAAQALAMYPACHLVDGRAETTTLPDHSVDLITVAQALHWFDPEPTRAEFARILKPDGSLAILRNYGTNRVLNKAIEQSLTDANGIRRSQSIRRPDPKPLSYYFGCQDFLKQTFPFVERVTCETFVGAVSSTSFAPDEDSNAYPDFEHRLRSIFERFSVGGVLEIPGETELCLGQISAGN